MNKPRARRQPPTILITGFDPFGGDTLNPSWEAARRLRGERIAGHRVSSVLVPTRFADCAEVLSRAIRRHKPEVVLCVGQAGGRACISIERVAINVIDARIADNAGLQPIDTPVIAGAPAAHFTTLPIKAMAMALREASIPAEISNSAGTFVCNALAFHLGEIIARERPTLRGGFIHIPYVPSQVTAKPGLPSMALDTIVDALRLCARVALTRREDDARSEGRTH